jgi:hypothetical protein
MKALSLTQPFATLIALGAKKIETRSWATTHRGLIAIHASKGLGPVGGERGRKEVCGTEPFCSVLNAALEAHTEHYWKGEGFLKKMAEHPFMPLGAIVATATLVDCISTNQIAKVPDAGTLEFAFGNYKSGRYMWLLDNVRPLSRPIPCKGALSLWEVSEEITERLR